MAIDVQDVVSGVYSALSTFCYDNQEGIAISVAILVLGGSALLLRDQRIAWKRKAKRIFGLRRGKTMTRKERKLLVKTLINNAIVSGIEEAVAAGSIKASEANHAFRQLAFFFQSNDYLPQKLPKSQRLSVDEYERIMTLIFNRTPVNLPGAKPGQVDNVHVYSKNNGTTVTEHKFGDKVRRRV